jgi:hypothetical protein
MTSPATAPTWVCRIRLTPVDLVLAFPTLLDCMALVEDHPWPAASATI